MPPKIQIIEDDIHTRGLLLTLFELWGYQAAPTTGLTVDEIVSEVAYYQPDVLVSDVHLRNINGLDILTTLRSHSEFSTLPILLTSGMELQYECLSAGATGFLHKPYSPDELLEWIRQQTVSYHPESSMNPPGLG